jgi:uncharacterized protein
VGAPPPPEPDQQSVPFWAALAEHRLVLERCTACGRHRAAPLPACPWCAATSTERVESTGHGRVYSWVTVHRSFGAPFADQVPYTVALIDLTEGCRALGRLEDTTTPVAAGLAVAARFVDHDTWTELRFAPPADRS